MKQQTLSQESSIKGIGLHTGLKSSLTLKPAEPNSGICFRRVDQNPSVDIPLSNEFVSTQLGNTLLTKGDIKVYTIEHILSALYGCEIDNAIIELDNSEPPIIDGSALEYVKLIEASKPVEQEATRDYIELKEPISVTRKDSILIALPSHELSIHCVSADEYGTHTQLMNLPAISKEIYTSEIAPARTFAIYEDLKQLIANGQIKGANLDKGIVIKGNQILSKEPMRFQNELARHKILDILGDIAILGKFLKAKIVAIKTGHRLNNRLTKIIERQLRNS